MCPGTVPEVLGAFAQPRHHYRPEVDPGVSWGTLETRRIVDDVHLDNTVPFPSTFCLPPCLPRTIVVELLQTDIVRMSSTMSKPVVCPCARPACAVIVRKIRPRGANARVRRIENTSITVRGCTCVQQKVLFRCKTGRTYYCWSYVLFVCSVPSVDGNERPGLNNMLSHTTKSRLRHSR